MGDFAAIFILGIEGKTRTITVKAKELKDYSVTELRQAVEVHTGIDVDSQRLIYIGKELKDENIFGKKMKMKDYHIHHNANIILIMRLPGGKIGLA